MTAVRWQSAVDFIVLAVAIFLLLRWSREARALRLALTIVALRVGALFTRQLNLLITSSVLDAATIVALLVLVVGFQPELRRAIMRLDLFGRVARAGELPVLAAVAAAASSLARARCGALIVLVQSDAIGELITGGVPVAARASSELLQAIFQKGSPIHDGAAIVERDQVTEAGVILPLTQRPVPEQYGTRHRAGLGLTERSDALVIVVSEERGEITLMRAGQFQPMADAQTLLAMLQALTLTDSERAGRRPWPIRAGDVGLAMASLALSAVVWSGTFLPAGKSVRVQTVPVEYINVPPGLTLGAQTPDTVQVWLRANDFVFESVVLSGLVERCNLANAHAGKNMIRLAPDVLGVPPGITVEGMSPRQLSVQLAVARAGVDMR
jgi:uncharacterized protein (TIGR00159 family)